MVSTTKELSGISQYSTLVRNTVVRAMAQVNGRWRFSDPWGSETPKPIKIKFGKIYCIGQVTPMQKLVYAVWRVCARRSGEIVRSRVLFFSSFVTCTEKTAQLTETLNILKRVSRACADS